MREKGSWLTDESANFGGFAVLRHPIIDPLIDPLRQPIIDFQCETDPCMYLYLVIFNRLCLAHCNCLFLFISIFVCLYLSII